jgi:tRNA threonylcarbamoyladenosine biosynthesis protein TsaE
VQNIGNTEEKKPYFCAKLESIKMNIEIDSIDTIQQSAQKFIEQIGNRTVFAFNGKMGAGKTTFIKSICEVMGVKEIVNSPTFSIVNEYEAADGRIIFHFDCYRINKIQEALDLGAEEYLYSGNLCFIEWSENIAPILPDSIVNVNIEEIEDGKRNVMIE